LIQRVSGGDTALAIGCGEQAAELARKTQERDLLATILNDLASVYAAAGEADAAEATLMEAEKILRQLNNPSMLGNTHNFLGMVTHDRGQFDRAVAYLEEGKVVTETLGDSQCLLFWPACGFAGSSAIVNRSDMKETKRPSFFMRSGL